MIDVLPSLLKSETASSIISLRTVDTLFHLFRGQGLMLSMLIDLACHLRDIRGREAYHFAGLLLGLPAGVRPSAGVRIQGDAYAAPFFYVFFSFGLRSGRRLIITGISEIHSIPFSRATLVFLFPFAPPILAFFTMVLAECLRTVSFVPIKAPSAADRSERR
jgi:hypothetical protein